MALNNFVFNGVDSTSLGLYVSGDKTFNSAEKEYTKVSIPGRSGDLLQINNRFKNVELEYQGIVIENYADNTEAIRAWLLSPEGYCRLEDSYHPNEYRMAYFAGPIDFESYLLSAGEATFMFDCKPQRWLKSGEIWLSVDAENSLTRTIVNPTLFEAKPIIRVWGTGSFMINDSEVKISDSTTGTYTDIDCDIQDCYEGSFNKNRFVSVIGYKSKWPSLKPGSNNIAINENSDITKIQILPRWWTI